MALKEFDLTKDLFFKQQKAFYYLLDDITSEIGYGGAASGGKSWLLAAWVVSHCLNYPDVGYGVARKELTILKKTTLLTVFKFMKYYGIDESMFKYNQSLHVITFKNDSQIFLIDSAYQPSDPLYTRFGGYELTGCAIDESNENDSQAISILNTRIGRRMNMDYGLYPKMLETFNPDKGHVYNRFYKPYRDNQLPEYRQFIPSLPADNPHTTEAYIKQLEKSDEITKQRLLYGNFDYDDALNKLFEYDKVLDLFTNSFVEEGKMFITADAAEFGADSIVIIVWCGLRVRQIIKKEKQSVKQTALDILELAREYEVPRSHIVIDDDGIGKGVTTHISGCKRFNNQKKALKEENYYNLQTQCLYYLAEYVNENKIYIEPDAVYNEKHKDIIIQELDVNRRAKADEDGTLKILPKSEIKRLIGKSPDFRDAFLMRMLPEIKPAGTVTDVYISPRNEVSF
jgi:hypothetical protein